MVSLKKLPVKIALPKQRVAHSYDPWPLCLYIGAMVTFAKDCLSCFDMLSKTVSPYKVVSYEEIYLWPCLSIHIKVSKAVFVFRKI